MNLPKPGVLHYDTLIHEIEKGLIKIPQFQRKFVWEKKAVSALLDSILKGYPIGTFIFWKTKEKLRSVKNLGGIVFPITPEGEFIQYVLDGQQRITSLYIGIKGMKIDDIDYSEIYVDLEAEENCDIVFTDIANKKEGTYIKVKDLIYGGLSLAKQYDEKHHEKIETYSNAFKTYSFSKIDVDNIPLDTATEIFTRINVGGVPLTVFEIMVAKIFDEKIGFDLSEKYNELINELVDVNYETIKNSTVLQTVAVCLSKECAKHNILRLKKDEFINSWDNITDSIKTTVEFFKNNYQIPVSQLLPYDGLIIPFSYFFFMKKDKPSGSQAKYLQDYFWRVVLTSRFSSALEAKIAFDIEKINCILNEDFEKYEKIREIIIDISPQSIKNNGWFSTGTAYIKGILCLYASKIPLSFRDNSIVNISNDWLHKANSKNYHHFFPKSYLEKNGVDPSLANNVANITIVDDYLNKRSIGAKSPRIYMPEFEKDNPKLQKALESHLIDDLNSFGILENNYEIFLTKRLEKISKELQERLIISDNDRI
ncbi:MAG: GmrSD restriction endonuclease domain-containing protein [Fusobacteriaceae bacterium]